MIKENNKIRFKILSLFVVLIMVLQLTSPIVGLANSGDIGALEDENEIVNIPDLALKRNILNQLGKSDFADITRGDMKRIRSITDYGAKFGIVYSLEGLQFAINLDSIVLHGPINSSGEYDREQDANIKKRYGLKDLTPISNLPKLRMINLSLFPINDLSPLKSLLNLEELIISGSHIKNLNGLENLQKLSRFEIYSKALEDISALKDLPSLKHVEIYYGSLEDIDAIGTLKNLEHLVIKPDEGSRKRVSDISPLQNLTNLKWLRLQGNQIEDISPLKNLMTSPNHLTLDLRENRIRDISPFVQGIEQSDFNTEVKFFVGLEGNYLNLNEGTDDASNLKKLANAGVKVSAHHQKVSVNPVYVEDTYVTGKIPVAVENIRVRVSTGRLVDYGQGLRVSYYDRVKVGYTDKNGHFSIKIPAQEAGTRILVTVENSVNLYMVGSEEIYVMPPKINKPVVNQVTETDRLVTGTTEAGAKVTVKAGTVELGSAIAGQNGKFSIAIAKQLPGTRLVVTAIDKLGKTSEGTEVVVKEVQNHYHIWGSKQNVDPSKVWKVKLSSPLDKSSLTNKAVYVLDRNGSIVATKATLEKDGQTIAIAPPDGGYQSGKTYSLYIENTLLAISGSKLKQPVKMDFTIKLSNV